MKIKKTKNQQVQRYHMGRFIGVNKEGRKFVKGAPGKPKDAENKKVMFKTT